ncbi:hypothetical protein BTS2_1994 [Bacillus sp. TS-2]|nr:hypothetical protein BTS2_1994 [Bacillus sp. TS-2]
MVNNTHINVTIDFSQRIEGGKVYDLRIPTQLTVKQLILNVTDTLNIENSNSKCSIKVVTKNLLITDDDHLKDYPVTDGDVLVVL